MSGAATGASSSTAAAHKCPPLPFAATAGGAPLLPAIGSAGGAGGGTGAPGCSSALSGTTMPNAAATGGTPLPFAAAAGEAPLLPPAARAGGTSARMGAAPRAPRRQRCPSAKPATPSSSRIRIRRVAAGTRPKAATSITAANARSVPATTWAKVLITGNTSPTAARAAITSRVTRLLNSANT